MAEINWSDLLFEPDPAADDRSTQEVDGAAPQAMGRGISPTPSTAGADPAMEPAQTGADPVTGPARAYLKDRADADPRGGGEATNYQTAVTGLASSPEEMVRYLAKHQRPDLPLDEAVKKYGQKDGVLYYAGPDGKNYVALKGGLTIGAAMKQLAQSGPMMAGTIASIMTMPSWGLPGGMAAGMAASAGVGVAAEIGRQKLGDALMGDASTAETEGINLPQVAREGVESGFGHGIGGAMEKMATRGAVRDLSGLDRGAMAERSALSARTDVPLTTPETTQLPSMKGLQQYYREFPTTADQWGDWLSGRDDKVKKAWGGFMDTMSGAADGETVSMKARDAAQAALKDMGDQMSKAAKPLYDEVRKMPIKITPVLEDVLSKPVMKDAMKQLYLDVANDIKPPVSPANLFLSMTPDGGISIKKFPSMQEWDLMKRMIDRMLKDPKYHNDMTGKLNVNGVRLNNLKNAFVSELDVQTGGKYAAARKVYSDGAEELQDGLGGILGALAKIKDPTILTAARNIFDADRRSPQMVARLKQAIEKQSPEAWQGVKRLYLDDVAEKALRSTETDGVVNPAGKLFKAFARDKLRNNMRVAMTPKEWDRFNDLMSVYKLASSVKMPGSPTQPRQLIASEVERRARPLMSAVPGFVKGVNPANENFLWTKTATDWLTNRGVEQHAKLFTELATNGDQRALQVMKELKTVSPKSQAFLMAFGQLISRAPIAAAAHMMDFDYEPTE